MELLKQLSEELHIRPEQTSAAVSLLDAGNTVPFISRYRKEATGGLDDTELRALFDRLNYLRSLEKRREEVSALIEAQGQLTDEVRDSLAHAVTVTEIDDIYRPFRPHRKTRASVAREKGLAPFAELLMEQRHTYTPSLEETACTFLNEESGVTESADVFAGACDILAEDVSDHADYRREIRALTKKHGMLMTKAATENDSVYNMYYDRSERIEAMPGHRVLAVNRGEKEGLLKVSIRIDEDLILNALYGHVVKDPQSPAAPYVIRAVVDSYQRLIAPSVERELRGAMFDEAGEGAIRVFSDNLRNLLLSPPVKGKTVLGLDPGYRTGCKLAVVDSTGKVLDTAVIYPTKPKERIEEAKTVVKRLITKHSVDLVSIGNGTASKESELFIAQTLKEMNCGCKYLIVSEAGASVYSASKLAADEFPDFDVTQRSAVSIARRLQDPLAELVKIDPKSIGVGQYQHDMKPARLDESLDGVVEYCVNAVGVDLNTASVPLLSHVSGVNVASAKNIVKYREENGAFPSRAALTRVPRIGAKAFEQCAGFLRVPESDEILDNTGVHPESYAAVHALLTMFGYTEQDIKDGNLTDLSSKVSAYGAKRLSQELSLGEATLQDILAELRKPGRDIRDGLPAPVPRDDVMGIEDLREGMVLEGTVRNVIDFGAFVDIGVHQDGLVHISNISNKFIRHPSEVLSVGDIVKVGILSVDVGKKRIALTMKL